MRDGIELAKLNIPCIVLAPDALTPLAREKALLFGLPDFPLAVLTKSLFGRPREGIVQLGREAGPAVLRALSAS